MFIFETRKLDTYMKIQSVKELLILYFRLHFGGKNFVRKNLTLQKIMDTNPNAVLKQIATNYVKIDPAALRKAKKIVEQFIRKKLIDAMKEVDLLFKVMFRNIYYTGSFFDGLRIEHPDEFDLNIVLDLKLPKQSFKVSRFS